jgi:hypothetical protein
LRYLMELLANQFHKRIAKGTKNPPSPRLLLLSPGPGYLLQYLFSYVLSET